MAVQLTRISINATWSVFNALYTIPANKQFVVSRVFCEPTPWILATIRINSTILVQDNIWSWTASAEINNFGKLVFIANDVVEINPSAGGYITLCWELLDV